MHVYFRRDPGVAVQSIKINSTKLSFRFEQMGFCSDGLCVLFAIFSAVFVLQCCPYTLIIWEYKRMCKCKKLTGQIIFCHSIFFALFAAMF